MKKKVILTAFILLIAAGDLFPKDDRKVIMGYCPSYSIDRISSSQMKSVTHLIYFALSPDPSGPMNSEKLKKDMKIIRKKLDKAPVQVLVAVGGPKSGRSFVAMTQDVISRESFIADIIDVAQKYSFDGIVLDWEYPEKASEMQLFVTLIQQLHGRCRKEGVVLVVSAPGWLGLSREAYASVDYIHLMSYDRPGRHATFEQAVKDIEYHRQAGAPPNKICLGIPLYGRSYKNRDRAMSYRTIVVRYRPSDDTDEVRGIYFNNLDTVKKKVKLVCEHGLAGIMFWELGQDSPEPGRSIIHSVQEMTGRCE